MCAGLYNNSRPENITLSINGVSESMYLYFLFRDFTKYLSLLHTCVSFMDTLDLVSQTHIHTVGQEMVRPLYSSCYCDGQQ